MIGSLKMAKLDFFTMRSQLVTYLSLVVILLSLGVMGSSVISLGINGASIMALMSISIFSIQEKNNLDRLYSSVSIRWKDIVLGRYIFLFLSYIISFSMAITIYLIFIPFQNKPFEFLNIIVGFSLSFLVFSVLISMQIPILFKMGYTKARAWALLPYLIVIGLIAAPSYMSGMFGFKDFPSLVNALSKFIDFVQSKQTPMIIGGILTSCIIQFFSYRVSVVAYRKRN